MRKPLDHSAILPWEDGLAIDIADPALPGVSIVIPIYNAGKFLEKTLRSLLCNDLSGCEIILMDGGSTDSTKQIVDHYSDIFASVTMEPDQGQSDAINKGFSKASKEILYWLNGDDIILPNVLNTVRERFRQDSELAVLVGDAYMTEIDFEPINHFRFSSESIQYDALINYAKNHLIQPSVFFSRSAWDAVGPLDLTLHYAMDADLFIGLSRKHRFEHLHLDIAYSVYHEDCKTRGKRAESITELAYVQSRHGGADQARETLGILVDLFNSKETENASSAAPDTVGDREGCDQCRFLKSQLASVRDDYEKNKVVMLRIEAEI